MDIHSGGASIAGDLGVALVEPPRPSRVEVAPGPKAGHMVQLDGLRGLAVISVVYSHYGPNGKLETFFQFGDVAVRLFFVLSGFLITGILLDARARATERGQPLGGVLKAFYIRRALRIFPLYYLVLAICVATDVSGAREFFWWHVTYMTNMACVFTNSWLPGLSHFWSLAVEEQFYLVWPVLVLFLPQRRLPVLLGLTVLLGPLSRGIIAEWTGELIPSIRASPSCLDSLGMGALLAYLHRREDWPALRRGVGVALLVAGLATVGVWMSLRVLQTGFTAKVVLKDLGIALLGAWLIDGASRGFRGPIRHAFEWRPLLYIGTISYGIYILHDVLPLIDRSLWNRQVWQSLVGAEHRGLKSFVVVLGVTCFFATLSWHLFESRLNRLKDRFPYVDRGHPKP